MISNFHTHTYLCHHAEGTVQDYIDSAKKSNCLALGFSDHCPFPDNVWPAARMLSSQAQGYVDSIKEARKNVNFPVYIGFECEWHPNYKNWYTDFLLGELAVDYLVFGSHWIKSYNEFLWIAQVQDKKLLYKYTDLTIQGIETGLFKFLAHPDIIMMSFKSWDADTKACLTTILDACISYNLPLEINGNGLERELILGDNGFRHPYPLKEFWELARDKKAQVICNSDAHTPSSVISAAQKAYDYAIELGIKPIQNIMEQ